MNTQKIVFPWKRAFAGVILALAVGCIEAGAVELPNPFFAMDTGTHDAAHNTPAEQVALVKEIGFAGVGPIYHNAAELQQWLVALDQNRLKMFALYLPLQLDDVPASLASIKEAAAALRGRDTLLWLYVTGKRGSRLLETNDETVAVQALREISGYGKDAGLRVALYPHTGLAVQSVEDAVRLAEKVHRKNLGVTFNLCHWLMVDGKDLAASLKTARPYLFCVTINGADIGGTSWKELIQPLDRGTYDVSQVLRLLRKMKYTGPIGLQHYGIGGDVRDNLEHSMEGWKRLSGAK
jgi:sugar phosphate isomerase/epimerase